MKNGLNLSAQKTREETETICARLWHCQISPLQILLYCSGGTRHNRCLHCKESINNHILFYKLVWDQYVFNCKLFILSQLSTKILYWSPRNAKGNKILLGCLKFYLELVSSVLFSWTTFRTWGRTLICKSINPLRSWSIVISRCPYCYPLLHSALLHAMQGFSLYLQILKCFIWASYGMPLLLHKNGHN